jgi:hypothetical protein
MRAHQAPKSALAALRVCLTPIRGRLLIFPLQPDGMTNRRRRDAHCTSEVPLRHDASPKRSPSEIIGVFVENRLDLLIRQGSWSSDCAAQLGLSYTLNIEPDD